MPAAAAGPGGNGRGGSLTARFAAWLSDAIYDLCGEGAAAPDCAPLRVVLRHLSRYQKGFLPFVGGTQEQPAYLMECLDVATAAVGRYEADRMAESRQDRENEEPIRGRGVRVWEVPEDATAENWQRRARRVR